MIIRGVTYDTIKALGKWLLPLVLAMLPLVQVFVDNGDFSPLAILSFAIALLTLAANTLQTISRNNYYKEEANGSDTD